jgi:NADP-dependent 3-hydroxy acid dehydrogenase YdfG
MDLFDKVVLITGASSGIGAACATAFAQAGAKVGLLARNAAQLEQLGVALVKVGHRAVALPADVTDRASVESAIATLLAEFGEIDVLVNNAGQGLAGSVAELSPDDYRQVLELNVIGWLNCLQTVVPVMRRQGGGVIISVNSIVSKINIPNLAGYSSTKHALKSLAHTARMELAPDNIRVISVYPNVTDTNFFRRTLGVNQNQAAQTEINRRQQMASPEFVAKKIVAAAREEPRDQYMTRRDQVVLNLVSLFASAFDKRIAKRQNQRNND